MSDETLDGGSPNGGTPTSPNAGGSQGQSVSDGSGDAQKLQAALDNLTKRLDEVDKRSRVLQSDKDRSVSQTKKEVEELKRKFAEVEKLKAKGYNDDDAFEELELRESIRVIREQLSNTDKAQTGNAGNGNGSAVDRAKTLQQYGLSENDPDVAAELNGKAFASEIELENAALKIAFKRANKPQPDASAASTPQGSPPDNDKLGSLKKAYETKLAEMRKGRPNPAQISELKAEFRKKGLEVW